MTKKRTYIVLLVILGLFCIIMFVIYGNDIFVKSRYSSTIIVGDNTVWNYDNGKWNLVRKISDFQKYNWQEYTIYLDNKKFGDYYLWHDDKWYAFDEKKNAIQMGAGNLVAYSSNHKINILDFESKEITDRTYINEVLEENDISLSSKFSSEFYTSLDFDNDGVEEDFYLITNVFPLNFTSDTSFSFVFMVKEGKVYYIYRDTGISGRFNVCKPYFNTFLDINNDKKYEFILSCGRYSSNDQVDMLYRFGEDGFKIIISNQ